MKPTDVIAYSVPGFFVFAMGIVLLKELAAEPYGLKLCGATIDSGSQVVSMLAPTVMRGLFYTAILLAVAGFAIASFTTSGAQWLKSLGGQITGKGRRLD